MGYKNIENMMDVLTQFIRSQIHDENVDQLIFFAQKYFSFSAFEEIADKPVEDLYGAVLSHWNLFLDLHAGKDKIHIYNPTIEEHGWQSTHTVIEMVLPDRAFILQSITMEINRYGFVNQLVLHPVYWVLRDSAGKLIELSKTEQEGASQESVLHVEINRQSDADLIEQLKKSLQKVLYDVRSATEDWPLCIAKIQDEIATLTAQNKPELQESIEFLLWLQDKHFVFLGYREYRIVQQNDKYGFKVVEQTGLGI
ncbi:MAG: NAD-glutamate dehydrogenase, partial [Thiotrichaceae bacterium]|nr:NAD-glutamate dehydrogenase [Thiotrichaceae bacterium]